MASQSHEKHCVCTTRIRKSNSKSTPIPVKTSAIAVTDRYVKVAGETANDCVQLKVIWDKAKQRRLRPLPSEPPGGKAQGLRAS